MRARLVWIAVLSVVCSPVRPLSGQSAPAPQSEPQIHKEWALGKQTVQDLDSRDGRIDNPALIQYLQRIENRLAAAAGQKAPEIRLTGSSQEYATVLANGVQYLSAGLAKRLENEMELAGLLAHQLAHRQVVGIPTYVTPCVLSPFGISDEFGPARNREQEATVQALSYLKTAGYDPTGLLDLFSKLAYEHPAWDQAIVSEDLLSLRGAIESEEPPSGGYRVSTSEFSEQHERLFMILSANGMSSHQLSSGPVLTRR
jgi:predicted Zn-dependent protease